MCFTLGKESIMQAIVAIIAALVVTVSATPSPPEASEVAKIIGIKPERVSRSHDRQELKHFTWSVRYLIDGDSGYSLSVILTPGGQIKADRIQMIRDSPELHYRRVESGSGDVIHHSLVDQGDLGTSYISMLVCKEGDWDLMVGLERKPEAKKDAPFLISQDGVRFAEELETLLRTQKPKHEK
jgi:hypothetical protein